MTYLILHIENWIRKVNTAAFLRSFKTNIICTEVVGFCFVFFINVTLEVNADQIVFTDHYYGNILKHQNLGFFLEISLLISSNAQLH